MGRFLVCLVALAACSFEGPGQQPDPSDADGSVTPDSGRQPGVPVTLTFRNGADYTGTQDAELDEGSPGSVDGDSDRLTWDFDGNWVLLKFEDIIGSDNDQISEGAEITSATLRLESTDSSDSANPGRIRRVLVPWDEGTSYSVFTGGGIIDAGEVDNSTFIDAPTSMGSHALDVTAFVAIWTADSTTNHGWIVQPTSTNGLTIHSSESADEQSRPTLEVTFVP